MPTDSDVPENLAGETLVFKMGEYAARIPGDRLYSTNHLWLLPAAGGFRVGFTAYSVRLLQDVYFLDWQTATGTAVKKGTEIGQIESSKAVSALFPPGDGRIVSYNDRLLNDPSAINTDNYGLGWLYHFDTDQAFLTADRYVALLAEKWEETQRIIKGQINEG